jgi:transcriptional regulator with XRE-family HTH domain
MLTQHPQKLRRRRILAGLKQERLGELAGYSKQHISELELGNSSASAECLLALSKALGCEIVDLVADELAA